MSSRRPLRLASIVLLTFAVSALFELLCCSPTDAENHLYPYRDPYLATLSVGMLRSRLPSRGNDVETLSITVIPSRENVYLMEGRGHLQALYFRQRHPAPLLWQLSIAFGGRL
jgi:hypothetical protein